MNPTPVDTGFAVVAVDGSEEGYAAVVFAAEHAVRRGVSLRLAHVMPAWVPVGPLLMIASNEGLTAYASETLASAVRAATDAVPEVEVSTHLLLGSRVAEVVDLAQDARFVVVGRRASSALDRVWSGGTLDGIVSRAGCPVYVVPGDREAREGSPKVVVGFKSADHAAALFDAAFRAARELGADLDVVHAWRLPGGYDDVIARRVSEAAWSRDREAEIGKVLAPWQQAYPDVRVQVRVRHDHPVRALVEASRDADRMVLVKPLHGGLLHHLGRTARGALRYAECPVEVVPAEPATGIAMPPFSIEEEGELVP